MDLRDIISHSLKQASWAPLELAAAAFARLGSQLAGPSVSGKCAGTYMPRWSALDSCSVSAQPLPHSAAHVISHELWATDACQVLCSWVAPCPTWCLQQTCYMRWTQPCAGPVCCSARMRWFHRQPGTCLQPWRPPCRIRTIACGGLLHKAVGRVSEAGQTDCSCAWGLNTFPHVLKYWYAWMPEGQLLAGGFSW